MYIHESDWWKLTSLTTRRMWEATRVNIYVGEKSVLGAHCASFLALSVSQSFSKGNEVGGEDVFGGCVCSSENPLN